MQSIATSLHDMSVLVSFFFFMYETWWVKLVTNFLFSEPGRMSRELMSRELMS